MAKPHLIVVANAAAARIFEQPRQVDAPTLVEELANPDGRRLTSELASDRMGTRANTAGFQPSAAPQSDPVEVAEENFARSLAQYIEGAVDDGRCSTISLFTSPDLLGRLRKQLSKRAGERVIQEEPTDLKYLPTTELIERLREMIPPRPIQ